jgi:hypothetical protein
MRCFLILIMLNIIVFSEISQVFSESFHESNFRISFIGDYYHEAFNLKEEDKLFDKYKNSISDIDTYSSHIIYDNNYHYGFEIDCFYTLNLFKPSFGKDTDPIGSCQGCLIGETISGIMFGIKSRYLHFFTNQAIYSIDGSSHSAKFMEYDVVELGPVVNLILGNPEDEIIIYLEFYTLYGRIISGEINAGASIREAGISLDKSEYYSKTSDGRAIIFGFGLFFSLNKYVPIFIGCSYNRSYFIFNFRDKIPVYDKNKISTWDENLNWSVGIYF